MRAQLRETFTDSDGDVKDGKAVTLYESDGTTPIATSVFTTPTGQVAASSLATDSNGELLLYSNIAKPIQIAIAGRSTKAVSAFVADRSMGTVWVTDFGATGNGTTNDMVAIRAAITALEAAGGGELYFPEGSYLVGGSDAGNEILLITKTVTLAGDGFVSNLVVATGTPLTCDVIRFHPSANEAAFCRVRDLHITHGGGVGAAATYARHAINIDLSEAGKFCRELHLEKLWIDGFPGRAVELTNPIPNLNGFFTSSIRDSWMMGGIRLLNCGDSIIIDSNTLSGANAGVEASQVSGATLLIITDNNISSDGGGVWIKSGYKPVVERNIIERGLALVGGSGNSALVDISGSISTVTGASVKDNVITVANPALAIDCLRLGDTDSASVSDNIFNSATGRVAITTTASTVNPNIGPNKDIGVGTMRPGATRYAVGSDITAATTIAPPLGGGDVFLVNGTTTIQTITPRGASDRVILFAGGTWALGSSGNIQARSASAMVVVTAIELIWVAALTKWIEVGR